MGDGDIVERLYEIPQLYDCAFSYRNVPTEVETILAWRAEVFGAKKPLRFLELAAGPGRHAIEFAKRGHTATAIDLSPTMCEYASMLAMSSGVGISIHTGDYTNFAIPNKFHIIANLLDSGSHILSLDGMISHFTAVACHLERDGIYVMEMCHPGDFFGETKRTKSDWFFECLGARYQIFWGLPSDKFDATTQIVSTTVRIVDDNESTRHSSQLEVRRWTTLELEAAARLSGKLGIHSISGAFQLGTSFDDTPRSWRMILILTRRD